MVGDVMVKVNVPVERGVAPLVAALSEIPGVITILSGERGPDGWAYVAFHHEGGWEAEVATVKSLSRVLGADPRTSDDPFSVSIEWYAGGGTPMCYVRMPAEVVTAAAEIISAAAATDAFTYDLVP